MSRVLRPLPLLRQSPLRSLRPSSTFFRIPHRSFHIKKGYLKVQHVKIKHPVRFRQLVNTIFLRSKSVLTRRYRLLGSTLRPLAYLGLTSIVLLWLLTDDEEEEHAPEVREKRKGEDSVEDDTIFIPLGFPYKLPRRYYKGTDPEWQSFIQLSKDRKLCNFLKNQLAGLVGQIGSIPSFQNALGENNKPRKFWIDIDFPQGPPPEYERKGLDIGEDHISWTTRPVHPLHYSTLQTALWPASLASSIWASQKTFASLQISKITNALAFHLSPEAPEAEKSNPPDLQLQKAAQQGGPQKHDSTSESDADMPPGSSTFNKESDESLTKNGSSDRSRLLPITPTIPDLGGDALSAVDAFKSTFARTWQPAQTPPERGTVMFSGLIELVGPKGIAVLDVRAVGGVKFPLLPGVFNQESKFRKAVHDNTVRRLGV
ncbi:MAG: hypothetical protein Q9197_003112 [Variospora fuerteventurae]